MSDKFDKDEARRSRLLEELIIDEGEVNAKGKGDADDADRVAGIGSEEPDKIKLGQDEDRAALEDSEDPDDDEAREDDFDKTEVRGLKAFEAAKAIFKALAFRE